MTDKEKLREVVRLAYGMYYAAQYLTTDASRLHRAMDAYHQFIITEYNKQEPASEDLEKASEEYAYTNWESDDYHEGASEGKPFDAIGHTQKCFIDGAQWQKVQIMKDAIEGEVFDDWQYGKETDHIAQPAIKLRCPELKIGQKVKVIIVKE